MLRRAFLRGLYHHVGAFERITNRIDSPRRIEVFYLLRENARLLKPVHRLDQRVIGAFCCALSLALAHPSDTAFRTSDTTDEREFSFRAFLCGLCERDPHQTCCPIQCPVA